MSNDLMIQGNGPLTLPAHLQGANFGVTTNLMEGMFTTGNRIGLKGSRFRLVVAGVEEGVIQEPYLDVILLAAAPAVSRVYYADAYRQGENQPPTCYSADGITPADDVKNKQSDKCMTCPMNAKGSKIVDGNKFKACSYFRRIVVMLAGDTDQRTVFKLDVKAQGLFGEASADSKNLNEYIKMLATRGVDAGAIVTRVSFDTDSSVPKLLFKPHRFIDAEEMNAVSDLVQSEEVLALKEVSMATMDLSHEDATSGDDPEADPPIAEAPTTHAAPQRPVQAAQRPAPAQTTQRPAQAAQRPAQAAPQRPAPAQTAQRPVASQRPAQATKPAVESTVPPPRTSQRPAAPAPAPAPAPVHEVDTDEELADLLAGLE